MEEQVIVRRLFLRRPMALTLTETHANYDCHCCNRTVTKGEAAYRFNDRFLDVLLHKKCAELPEKIRHPMHPQHKIQFEYVNILCTVCEKIDNFGYFCTSSDCNFKIDFRCAVKTSVGVLPAADDDAGGGEEGEGEEGEEVVEKEEEKRRIKHPSHPQHELSLLRRKHSFDCDACGATHKGMNSSYVCTSSFCQYWVHKSCTSLPPTMQREHLHHHPLSLAFHLPEEYIIYDFKCDICCKTLPFKHWIYHCQSCRYVVHINCAINPSSSPTNLINNADAADVIKFPINDISEELIKPFVMREGGKMINPHDKEFINGEYWFHNHHHQLNLISSSSQEQKEEVDDDDYVGNGRRSELICDGCITPIYQKKTHESSSSSSDKRSNYYLSCFKCKYFLHLACFGLPLELLYLSPPLDDHDHKLKLQTFSELDCTLCIVCFLQSNGLFYACTECGFKADVKCASLPSAIKHPAHPQHHLYLEWGGRDKRCGVCDDSGRYYNRFYSCGSCGFTLCGRCAVLPTVVNDHGWDKHPLPLTYDACINHPSVFYCDFCEEEMNPKEWMYHCRVCDHSFHPGCFPAKSGSLRHIKFGRQYVVNTCHPHPLTHQVITTKIRCDLCYTFVYNLQGFHCASCDFVMCFDWCHQQYKYAMHEVID